MEQITSLNFQNFYALLVIFGSALFLYFFFHKNGKWKFLESSFNLSTFKVRLSAEPQTLSDEIPKMEMIFQQLLSKNGKFWREIEMGAKGRWWRRILRLDGQPYIGAEVSVIDKIPAVYFLVPDYTRNILAQIVNSQFPNTDVSKVDDYTIFQGEGEAVVKKLTFKKDDLQALNTDLEFPLVRFFKILERFSLKDSFGFQILFYPYPESWHEKREDNLKKERDKIKIEFRGENKEKDKRLMDLNNKLRKTQKQCCAANVRIVFSSYSKDLAEKFGEDLKQAFNGNDPEELTSNEFKVENINEKKGIFDYTFRKFDEDDKITLNIAELAWIIQLY